MEILRSEDIARCDAVVDALEGVGEDTGHTPLGVEVELLESLISIMDEASIPGLGVGRPYLLMTSNFPTPPAALIGSFPQM